jgi:transposase InsO family protein
MDLGKSGRVTMNVMSYRYVLSVIDIFSRFVWLRAMSGKTSKDIAKSLQSIYYEHGPPRVIQCDQGTEFKGAIKKMCKRFETKIICSRPYHPQSQGKVERSHMTLRSKIEYDLAKMCEKGVNWASGLPIYQRILNEDPKEVLAYHTPFEVYYGRKCNSFKTAITNSEVAACCEPTRNDLRRRTKHIS